MKQIQQHHQEVQHINRGKWALIGFLIVAGFFLFSEHRAHFLGILPYLLILACPLMHLFHHGHGRHGSSGGTNAGNAEHRQGPAEEKL